jgi:hypothetical protein
VGRLEISESVVSSQVEGSHLDDGIVVCVSHSLTALIVLALQSLMLSINELLLVEAGDY